MTRRWEDQLSEPLSAARAMLGATVEAGDVAIRIVEVEAYGGPLSGPWPDPAAHSFRGQTARNQVMFGPPGRLYVYLSYGLHMCANVVCGPDGVGAAVLLRAGEVLAGHDVVRERRPTARRDRDLARGPGNLGSALGLTLAHNGTHLLDDGAGVRLTLGGDTEFATGPRVGVSTAAGRPWRLWIPGSPAVSAFRRSPRAPA